LLFSPVILVAEIVAEIVAEKKDRKNKTAGVKLRFARMFAVNCQFTPGEPSNTKNKNSCWVRTSVKSWK
jgi:hypothetical protein